MLRLTPDPGPALAPVAPAPAPSTRSHDAAIASTQPAHPPTATRPHVVLSRTELVWPATRQADAAPLALTLSLPHDDSTHRGPNAAYFKFMTNRPERYRVRPAVGRVAAGEAVTVQVRWADADTAPVETTIDDRVLVQVMADLGTDGLDAHNDGDRGASSAAPVGAKAISNLFKDPTRRTMIAEHVLACRVASSPAPPRSPTRPTATALASPPSSPPPPVRTASPPALSTFVTPATSPHVAVGLRTVLSVISDDGTEWDTVPVRSPPTAARPRATTSVSPTRGTPIIPRPLHPHSPSRISTTYAVPRSRPVQARSVSPGAWPAVAPAPPAPAGARQRRVSVSLVPPVHSATAPATILHAPLLPPELASSRAFQVLQAVCEALIAHAATVLIAAVVVAAWTLSRVVWVAAAVVRAVVQMVVQRVMVARGQVVVEGVGGAGKAVAVGGEGGGRAGGIGAVGSAPS
ncbi:hypothetical protein AMAG_10302 [Allomyces macrogynus ATCC 38327]|uniref:MSP domain-containing protein n=1 Tax=Allomyces macrogynus (strain ATCC 38327) TaxID=578462 RepID=A0A0L0SUH1_ALLM3|nr:hypothetical protein AMAG_10302 [Allomyces macrogynus ATCC 38327]|eukprot:KNE66025.1 hypothetical protein AMAG_10302 [Allomyces macrogynus ATCC 38327]